MPLATLTRAEAEALRKMTADEVRGLAVQQRSLIAEGLRRAKESTIPPGDWLTQGVSAMDISVKGLLDRGDAKLEEKPQTPARREAARTAFDTAYREARYWHLQVEIPVNFDRFAADLEKHRTLLDSVSERWAPWANELQRIKRYIVTGNPKDVGVNQTPESIARLIKVSLPNALSEELARNGGSYEMLWTTYLEGIKDLAEDVTKAVKRTGDSIFWLALAGAALLVAHGYSKRGGKSW